jgi:NDP-sugar pyrophosphorylase family protein
MGGTIPKALVPLTDKPNLTTTLQQIGSKFTNVFVVTNEEIQPPWEDYFVSLHREFPEISANVINLPIYSGRGDGHAVWRALIQAEGNEVFEKRQEPLSDDIVIAWGDVFFPDGRIVDELLAKPMAIGIVPVVREDDPYVALELDIPHTTTNTTYHPGYGASTYKNTYSLFDEEQQKFGYPILHAKFSKFGEIADGEIGYHDQSVFRFNRTHLLETLDTLDEVMDRNGKYISPNGELSLLYTFHYLANHNAPVHAYETHYPTMSFNTVEEVAQIQQEIDRKWKTQVRNQSS